MTKHVSLDRVIAATREAMSLWGTTTDFTDYVEAALRDLPPVDLAAVDEGDLDERTKWADSCVKLGDDWCYSDGWIVVHDSTMKHVMLARLEAERVLPRPWQAARVAARHGAGVDYEAGAREELAWRSGEGDHRRFTHSEPATAYAARRSRAIVDAALNSRGPGRGEEQGNREAFEAWAYKYGLSTMRSTFPAPAGCVEDYAARETDSAWAAWQASARAARQKATP